MQYGSTTIVIHDDFIPKDRTQYEKNLQTAYDRMNEIYRGQGELFYSPGEIEQLRKKEVIV